MSGAQSAADRKADELRYRSRKLHSFTGAHFIKWLQKQEEIKETKFIYQTASSNTWNWTLVQINDQWNQDGGEQVFSPVIGSQPLVPG